MSEFDKDTDTEIIREDNDGEIQIGSDVVGEIVRIAITDSNEFEGKMILNTRAHITDGIPVIGRKRKDDSSSISVSRDENTGDVTINVDIRIVFGEDMYDLATKLRNHIKHTVEKMTRVEVKQVNVKIVGVFLSQVQDEDDDEKVMALENSEE